MSVPWQQIAGAITDLFGSAITHRGSRRAAAERERAWNEATGIVTGAYDEAEELYQPRSKQEQEAMARVSALLGLPGGDGSDPTEVLRNTPGYKFKFDQGQQATERVLNAGGGYVSGNTLAALNEYGQGVADQGFYDYLAQVMHLQDQGVDNVLAGLNIDRGNSLADLRLGAGGARASGIEGKADAWASHLKRVGGSLMGGGFQGIGRVPVGGGGGGG